MKKTDNPYRELANAIIVQAVKDYRAARRTYNLSKVREIQKFFRSSYSAVICNLDSEALIQKLDREVGKQR